MNKQNLEKDLAKVNKKKGHLHSKIRLHSQNRQQTQQNQNAKILFNKYMKYLISTNAGYFKNKLCADFKNKHKNMQLRIPSSTGNTTYKKDFIGKQKKIVKQETLKHILSTDNIQMNNYLKPDSTSLKLDGRTTYQKSYKRQNSAKDNIKICRRKEAKLNSDDDDVPRFFDTQNKVDFLNWGGKNYVPSMKPTYKPAISNCSFQGSSVYKNDFQRKVVKNSPTLIREQSISKLGNWSSITKTSYSNDFSEKIMDNIQINCKPKQFPTSYFKQLRGRTEYKRQFIKNFMEQKDSKQENQLSLFQLQELIIDL